MIPHLKDRKRIRCVVIQLARLGDTIQSLMALRAAKQLYPEMEIHFVARETFATAAKKVPWIQSVTTLPTESFIWPIQKGEVTEKQMLGQIAKWVSPLIGEPWDMLINWTFSESSSYLAAILPARVKLGYSRRADGTLSALDGWSHYMQAVVQTGLKQNIHLTDILTTQLLTALQIHAGDPMDPGNEPVTSRAFFTLEFEADRFGPAWRDHSKKWIGIQLGAANASKTWDPENWAGLASFILARHPAYSIVLLGGREDKSRVDRFMAKLKALKIPETRVVSMVGQTGFDFWATLVGRCEWLIAGDTAAIHLASILGTRVLNISVGPVRHEETGPYGNGHYIISSSQACKGCEAYDLKNPANHTCRDSIAYEAAYATWAYASSEWAHRRKVNLETHLSRLGWSQHSEKIEVSRSRIRSTEDGGGVVYESMLERPLSIIQWSSQVIGTLARAWYCGWLPPIGHELKRSRINPTLVVKLREMEESATVLHKIFKQAEQASHQLESKASHLKSSRIMDVSERAALQEAGDKLTELDDLVQRTAAVHPCLEIFPKMSKVLMHNLRGNKLSDLGRESAISYEQLAEGTELLKDWISHTLRMARPIAIVEKIPTLSPNPEILK